MTRKELEKIRDNTAEKMATNRWGDYDDLELPQEAADFLQEVEDFKSGFDCATDLLMKEIELLRQYGNKDCTAMADDALAKIRKKDE